MKYIRKQKHEHSCRAIAYANVCKRLGIKMSLTRALRICGGLKKIKRDGGITIHNLKKIFEKKGFDVATVSAPWSDIKWVNMMPNVAIVMCYGWVKKGIEGGHFTVLDQHGKLLNDKYRIPPKRYFTRTRRLWGMNPIYIIVRK